MTETDDHYFDASQANENDGSANTCRGGTNGRENGYLDPNDRKDGNSREIGIPK
jgi:hypothetical protein